MFDIYSVSFPKMGLNLNISPIAINIFGISIYWYGIIVCTGFLLGFLYSYFKAKLFKLDQNKFIDIAIFSMVTSIIGARFYYVIFCTDLSYYLNNPIKIFAINEGGLAVYGGIILAVIAAFILCRAKNISIKKFLDVSSFGILTGQSIGRWGNFFNQEAHGTEVTLEFLQKFIPFQFIIDGMNINGVYYHPTFLYESLWCFLGFILLLIVRRFKYLKIGQLTGLYLFWYGMGRFFIEGLRTDSLMLGDFRVAQIVSIACMVIGAIIIVVRGAGFKLEGRYNQALPKEKPTEISVNQFIKQPSSSEVTSTPSQPVQSFSQNNNQNNN